MAISCTPSEPTATPTVFDSRTPDSASNETVKKVSIFDKYTIEVPGNFTVQETLPSSMMDHSYDFETPNGIDFTINLHPYNISSSPVPGKCVVSTDFDAGITSAPIFCEGLELTDFFIVPAGWPVKYGSVISDLSLACTMNSPCPVEVSPDTRYSIEYVFVVPDKSHSTILEFFVGDAFRSPSSKIESFEGLGAVLHNLIIPSLSTRNP